MIGLNVVVLFEIGANAIIDGYYRESVSSFAASLERFYEFYANVIFIKFNISKSVYEKTSDLMSRYSERQLGAFVALYALENKTAPILLNTKNVEFRNRVIHRGTIPTKEEAINYGSVVLDTIRPVLSSLKKNYKKEIGETIFRHKDEIQKKSEGAKNIATLVFPTIISLASSDKERDAKPLKEIIQEMEKKKQKS